MSPPLLAIRRYPVKAMGGESLDAVRLDERGLAGDRWYAVVDEDGRLACGKDSRRFRRRDGVFDHRAATGPDGVVTVTGPGGSWQVGEPALDDALAAALGDRVRVNLLVETSEPFEEEGWVGQEVELGEARLRVVERIERCRTIDVARPGTVRVGDRITNG